MRILVITVVHIPLDARIHHRQVRALVAAGIEVTYAAPFTATGTDPAALVEGIRHVDLPRAHARKRLASLHAARALLRRDGRHHDVVLLHDPELVAAVIGLRRRLPPVVLDVHEDLVGSITDRTWIPPALRPVAKAFGRALERWAEKRLHLLLAEEGYARRFRYPHPVIRNLPWLVDDTPPAGSEQRVVHVGRLSIGRGLNELLEVGAALRRTGGPTLELVGAADREVEDRVHAAHQRGDVRWHGFLPSGRAQQRVAGSVAGLALLHDEPNYRVSRPTKLVEYLAAGVPIITTPLPMASELVAGSADGPVGLLVPFEDAEAVVAAVRRLAADTALRTAMSERGRRLVRDQLSWDAESQRFVRTLRGWAGETPVR